eukprot:g7671.t1
MLRDSIYNLAVVFGCLLAFIASCGIGANDAANAFATSVGAKSVTLGQAVVLAAVFEFAGAMLVGSRVEETIRDDIVRVDKFTDKPELLAYGMLCVLAATGVWLFTASYLEIPVSTTHSLVGGIIGIAIVAEGWHSVYWSKRDTDESDIEQHTGVASIAISWAVSPILSGLLAAGMFYTVRKFILRTMNSERRAYLFFPALVAIAVTINTYFVIYKGFCRKIDGKTIEDHLNRWSHLVAWGMGILCALFVGGHLVLYRRNRTPPFQWRIRAPTVLQLPERASSVDPPRRLSQPEFPTQNENLPRSKSIGASFVDLMRNLMRKVVERLVERDLHAVIQENQAIKEIHEEAEQFDRNTEEIFKKLQVFTAICDAFAHGANDVANAIGPLNIIFTVYQHESVENHSKVRTWMLAIGAFGLVVGLVTYGYNIMRAIGVKLTKITPSRGFAIELGAAIVVIVGSYFGVPLSTTYCQVGATVGVGLLEGSKGVNLKLFAKMFGGWIATIIIAFSLSAGFFAQGAYAPSIVNTRDLNKLIKAANDTMDALNNTKSVNLNESDIKGIMNVMEDRDSMEFLVDALKNLTHAINQMHVTKNF